MSTSHDSHDKVCQPAMTQHFKYRTRMLGTNQNFNFNGGKFEPWGPWG